MMIPILARLDELPGILFLGFVAFIILLIVIGRLRKRAFQRMLGRVAEWLDGVYEAPGLFEYPTIRFRIEGRPATIQFEDGSRPFTSLRVDLRGRSPGALKIVESRFGRSIKRFFGAQDLGTGDGEFDRQYVVQASPESLAPLIFTPQRRFEVTAAVRRLRGLHRPSIELTDGILDVEVKSRLDVEDAVKALAKTGMDFTGYLLHLEGSEGIQWIEGRGTDTGHCPVCGTGLQDEVVRCADCSLPHHPDCWAWLGKCSAYACNGKRSRTRAA